MRKLALSVLIVFYSVYAGIAEYRLQNLTSTTSNLINFTSAADLDSLALVALYDQCNGVN
jgi:hypothetical protein